MTRMLPLRSLLIILALALATLGSTGCAAKKKPVITTGSETGRGAFSGADGTGTRGQFDPSSLAGLTDEEAMARLRAAEADALRRAGANPELYGGEKGAMGTPIPELGNIYFSFDSDALDNAANLQLEKNIAYLKANPSLRVVLRGHTDSEGTEQYNIALGSRRAQTVRDALVNGGINGDVLETVSYGEMLPAVEGEDAAAQSQNRRVEFFVYTVE